MRHNSVLQSLQFRWTAICPLPFPRDHICLWADLVPSFWAGHLVLHLHNNSIWAKPKTVVTDIIFLLKKKLYYLTTPSVQRQQHCFSFQRKWKSHRGIWICPLRSRKAASSHDTQCHRRAAKHWLNQRGREGESESFNPKQSMQITLSAIKLSNNVQQKLKFTLGQLWI